jgi:hypothetical protein
MADLEHRMAQAFRVMSDGIQGITDRMARDQEEIDWDAVCRESYPQLSDKERAEIVLDLTCHLEHRYGPCGDKDCEDCA